MVLLQVAANGDQQQQPQQQQPNMWQTLKGMAFRMFVIYVVMSFFRGRSSTPSTDTTTDGSGDKVAAKPGMNLFSTGTIMVSGILPNLKMGNI